MSGHDIELNSTSNNDHFSATEFDDSHGREKKKKLTKAEKKQQKIDNRYKVISFKYICLICVYFFYISFILIDTYFMFLETTWSYC